MAIIRNFILDRLKRKFINGKRKERRKKNETNPFFANIPKFNNVERLQTLPQKQRSGAIYAAYSTLWPLFIFLRFLFLFRTLFFCLCLVFSFASVALIIIFLFFSAIRCVFRAPQPLPIRGRKCLIFCSTKYRASIFRPALPYFSFFSFSPSFESTRGCTNFPLRLINAHFFSFVYN